MTRDATYTAADVETADRIANYIGIKSIGRDYSCRGDFRGRSAYRTDETTFELYASNRDHADFERMMARFSNPAPAKSASADTATPKQIAFLTKLIRQDPGAAMTIGASSNGSEPTPGLTKARASAMIDNLKAGV